MSLLLSFLRSRDILYAFYHLYLFYNPFKLLDVAYHDRKISLKQAGIRINRYRPEGNVLFFRYERSYVGNNANVVVPYNAKCDRILRSY